MTTQAHHTNSALLLTTMDAAVDGVLNDDDENFDESVSHDEFIAREISRTPENKVDVFRFLLTIIL